MAIQEQIPHFHLNNMTNVFRLMFVVIFLSNLNTAFALSARECRSLIADLATDAGRMEWERCLADPYYSQKNSNSVDVSKDAWKSKSIEELMFSRHFSERSHATAVIRKDPRILFDALAHQIVATGSFEKCGGDFIDASTKLKMLGMYVGELSREQAIDILNTLKSSGALNGYESCEVNRSALVELVMVLSKSHMLANPPEIQQFVEKHERYEQVTRLAKEEESRQAYRKQMLIDGPKIISRYSRDELCDKYGELYRGSVVSELFGWENALQALRSEIKKRGMTVSDLRLKERSIQIGSSRCTVVAVMGEPRDVNYLTTARAERAQMVYGLGSYVYLENGRVTAIQE